MTCRNINELFEKISEYEDKTLLDIIDIEGTLDIIRCYMTLRNEGKLGRNIYNSEISPIINAYIGFPEFRKGLEKLAIEEHVIYRMIPEKERRKIYDKNINMLKKTHYLGGDPWEKIKEYLYFGKRSRRRSQRSRRRSRRSRK
jgi:hypothetical protein